MKSKSIKSSLVLLLAAAVWGFAFVAQRMGMEHIGPFTFNGIRFIIGSLSLLPLMAFLPASAEAKQIPHNTRLFYSWGITAGVVLFAGSSVQQIGLVYTTAGNAGFITGLYVIFVPILGLLLRHKTSPVVWLAAAMAVTGMYFLSVREGLSVNRGDVFVLISAFFFAIHVLVVGHVTNKYDALKISFVQFLTCGILSSVVAISFEVISLHGIEQALIPLLYGGLVSVGVGYTLQMVGQKNAKPAPAAIILSAEAVFAVIGGVWILSETMDSRALFGCCLMLAGMILAQMRFDFSLPKQRAQKNMTDIT